MPINCAIEIDRTLEAQFGELDYQVMGEAFAIHGEIGRLANESIYKDELANRLIGLGMQTNKEVGVDAVFDSFSKRYRLDAIACGCFAYELKATTLLTKDHEGQLLNYLRLLDLPSGKLVNFRNASVQSKFVNSPARKRQRTAFAVDHVAAACHESDRKFRQLLIEILRDWGTGLSLALYRDAVLHLLKQDGANMSVLSLQRDGRQLGNQSFDLLNQSVAFRVTALSRQISAYAAHLQKLLALSPLDSVCWANITLDQVSFRTLQN